MAIQMRRGNKANLDKTKLVAGEIAVSLDTKEVSVSDGNGDTIDLATKDDLQNIIKLNGGVTIDENTLVISPEEETTEEQGTPVDIESISIDGGMTDNPIKDATARADISSVGGRVTTLEGKIGANNGIATLNGTGKVPESQLPSYVDDVIEGYLYNGAFYEDSAHTTLITGESGKIYVDLSTDKTYRWSGTVYVCTGSSLELGETQGTAYEGSKGKANADNIADIQSVIPANASTSNKLATMEDVGGDAVWGGITGSLNDQTDLKAALDKKCGVDDSLYQFDESADIPFYMVSEPKTRKVSFTDFRKKITSSFYDFVRKTVGFTTKNIADTSKAEIGVNGAGTANSKRARLIVPCDGSTSYRVTSSGTNNFTQIDYMTTDTLPPSGGYSGLSFPATITTHESDKYIVFVFKKSTDVTQSDVDALKMMVKESSVTDDTYEPYHASVDVAKANRDEVKDAIGWSGKNKFNPTPTGSAENATITNNGKNIVISNATAGTWKSTTFDCNVKKNTDYVFKTDVDWTSGVGIVSIRKIPNITIVEKANITSDQTVELSFNSGENETIRIALFCTGDTSEIGNIAYNNAILYSASIADDTYEPYHPSVEQTLRDAEVIEGKNKLQARKDLVSQTLSGITFTIYRDANGEVEKIRANGTSTAAVDYMIVNNTREFNDTPLTLSGCNGGSSSTYWLAFRVGSSTDQFVRTINNHSGDTAIDSSNMPTGDQLARVQIHINNGVTLSNVDFYPMLRDPSENNTFEPYYIPLKDSKFDRSEQRVLGAKNALYIPNQEKKINGVTATVIDGVISFSGTNSSSSATWFDLTCKIRKGTYKFNGIDTSQSVNNIIQILTAVGGTNISQISTDTPEATFTLNDDFEGIVFCRIAGNGNASGIKAKPMIRLASDSDDTYAPYAMTNREITEALTVQESAVTDIISGATVYDNTNYLVKYGKVVQLMLQLSNVTTSAAWSQIICKIPSGFRPKRYVRDKDSANDTIYNIATNGEVVLGSVVSDKSIRISATWITS